jgi:hypothetical protein
MIDTFERIRAMGGEPRYQRGYHQLVDFMESTLTARLEDAPEEVGTLILEELDRPLCAEVIVERNDVVVASCSFEQAVGAQVVRSIEPGDYCLKLDTGRILWEGNLSEKDLVWSKAYPGEGLALAADSEERPHRLTREFDLLDGTLALRVYPGVETGSFEIELKDARSTG